ncbi:MAG: carboxymethylenebutenolidase, partial [bacterium]
KIDNVKEFQVKLKKLNSNHEVYIYPNTGHAFASAKGSRYNKEAANTAWKRTITFLNKYL